MHAVNPGGGDKHEAVPSPFAADFDGLFAGGASYGLQSKLGLVVQGRPHLVRRVLVFLLVSWVPLVLLAALEKNLYTVGPGEVSFLADLGALARYLIAGPLLLAGESIASAALSNMAHRFAELRPGHETGDSAVAAVFASVRRLRDAPLMAVVVVVIAYAVSAAVYSTTPHSALPKWHYVGVDQRLSLAGWWAAAISVPLLLMLLLRWLWRLLLWARFLRLVARLDLRLIPVHPDKAAGVAFIGYSVRAFALYGAAIGTIVAGPLANQVLHRGAQLGDYQYAIAGVVVLVVVVCTAPLLAFSGKLLEVWKRGVREYDELASDFGREFEHEWFGVGRRERSNMLDRGDFSAATDLYQVVDRIHDLRLVPVDLVSIAMLACATLLPFVPIFLLVFPFDQVVDMVFGLLR